MSDFYLDICEGKVRAVKSWLEKGANVNEPDDNGNYPLHLATEKGYRGVCKVLLDAGARANQRNHADGWTALHLAAIEGHTDVLRMLLAHGTNLFIKDNQGHTAEYYADRFHNFESLKVIQEFKPMHSDSESTLNQGSDSDRTLTDESDEDESSMMNWVIYGNIDKQPNHAKRSRSRMKTAKSEECTIYEEYASDHLPQYRVGTVQNNQTEIPGAPKINLEVLCQPAAEVQEVTQVVLRPPPPPGGRQPPPYHLHDPALQQQSASRGVQGVPAVQPLGGNTQIEMFSPSSATIPDDLSEFEGDFSETESEKVVLLKRLQCLVADENEEKKKVVDRKKENLRVKEEQMQVDLREVEANNKKKMEKLIKESRTELLELKKSQQEEEDRIQEEIDKLELEQKNLNSSSLLVSSLLHPLPAPAQDRGYLSGLDIEDEISCCSCHILLRPPNKIYQCTNGDLFCCKCRGKPVCPACGVYLTQTIRNKALEKIAKKHF